jgi:hypothetical protein
MFLDVFVNFPLPSRLMTWHSLRLSFLAYSLLLITCSLQRKKENALLEGRLVRPSVTHYACVKSGQISLDFGSEISIKSFQEILILFHNKVCIRWVHKQIVLARITLIRLVTCWKVRGSKSLECEISCTRPDWSWGQESVPDFFPGVKRPGVNPGGRGVAGIGGSNSAGVMEFCLLWVLCFFR